MNYSLLVVISSTCARTSNKRSDCSTLKVQVYSIENVLVTFIDHFIRVVETHISRVIQSLMQTNHLMGTGLTYSAISRVYSMFVRRSSDQLLMRLDERQFVLRYESSGLSSFSIE